MLLIHLGADEVAQRPTRTRRRRRAPRREPAGEEPRGEASESEKDPAEGEPERKKGGLAMVARGWKGISTGWKGISGVVATIATAVGVLTTLGLVGGDGGAPGPADAVASAASKTAKAGSSTVRVSIFEAPRGASEGRGETIVGTGAFDYREGRAQMEFDLSRRTGSEELSAVEVIFNGPSFYVRDAGAFDLPRGKRWLRVSFDDAARIEDAGELGALSGLRIDDPTNVVASLDENASEPQKVGEEPLYGVTTTHYRAKRDPDGAGPRAATTVDAWVDEAGYLRKLETLTPTAAGTTKVRTELDEFGVTVDAKPPPSSQVLDFGSFLRGQ